MTHYFWTVKELTNIYNCLDQFKSKIRIESSFISLYSTNIEELQNIALEISKKGCERALCKIFYPESNVANELLNGKIHVKKIDPKYNYKVTINPGALNEDNLNERINVYNYIYNLGDQVKFSNGFKQNMLGSNRYWANSTYFYCQEESIVTFLKLMAPDLISGIYTLVRE